jgi:hypothetical protein
MKTRYSAVILLLVLAASVAWTQGRNPNVTGAGARAAGMGNAFIGVADDATAVVWNPGGLTQLERMEMSAVGRYVMESSEANFSFQQMNSSNSTSQSHPVFNFGSFAVPFTLGNNKLVIAAAYQRQLDFYGSQSGPDYTSEEEGGADAVSPSIAFGLGPVFSLGLTGNIWFGKDNVTNTSTTQTAGAATVTTKDTYDGTASGFNFLGGILVDLNGLKKPVPIKFGASIRTPFDLEFDYTTTSTTSGRTTKDQGKQTNQVPVMIGFGLSGCPTENLTLALDFEIRKFGDSKTITKSNAAGSKADTSDFTMGHHDLNQFRVGAEYLMVMRSGVIPLRVGFRTAPTAYANANLTSGKTSYDDQVIGKTLTVGTGFIGGTFAFDLAYAYTTYEWKWAQAGQTFYTVSFTEHMLTSSVIIYF